MATRDDVTTTFVTSPRILEVQAPSTEMTMQDLVDTTRKIEDTFRGMSEPKLINASGKEDLGGGVQVGITAALQDALLAFEGRTTPAETGTVTNVPSWPIAGQQAFDDSVADFVTAAVHRGSLVINFTDQSIAEVVSVESATRLVTKTLVNGIGNNYDNGDVYHVFNVTQCNATGGNLVAVDDVQAAISAILPTAFTQVVLTASSSATSQNAASIEYAAFVNACWVDVTNGVAGTGYAAAGRPIGTPQDPVNNIPDAISIISARGLPRTIIVRGDLTLTTGDDVTDHMIYGENPQRTTITIEAGADTQGVEIRNAVVTGTLDGYTIIRSCYVFDINYFNGFIYNCELAGTIYLDGSSDANFIQCYAGANDVTIDMGGTGRNLNIAGFSGDVILANKTGNDIAKMHVTSASITLAASVTDGDGIHIDGTGEFVNNSAITPEHVNMVDGRKLELLYQHFGLDPNAPVTINEDGSVSFGTVTIAAVTTGTTPNRQTVKTRTA